MALPSSAKYLIVGAGLHGLSTAYHLGKLLEANGTGSGADIVILEKSHPGAGASGIACGVVRNNYFQPAMQELMQACVEVWESDPVAYSYNPVGYMAIGGQGQVGDLTAVYERQAKINYASTLVTGASECDAYMKNLFPDWRAKGVEIVVHEHKGGFAHNMDSVAGMQRKAESTGARVLSGVEVQGFEIASDGSVKAAVTSQGRIECEQLIVAPGPWAKHLWAMLEMPATIDIRTGSGDVAKNQPMWTYWNLQEGEISVDPKMFSLQDGSMPPVIHLDTDAPLYSDEGKLITDELWGIYYKQDRHGIQGGASPLTVGPDAAIDPYPSTTDVDDEFPDMWCAALSHAMSRFEGTRPLYKQARSGGMGAFTADNFPVFDYVRPNVYGIFDSNHGYKMLGVGREVAKVLVGDSAPLLSPFRFERFATGDLHPVSNSPYPWS